jgi:hypothetical protein
MLQTTKELIRAGNGPEDYAIAQKFAITFANQERVAIDMFPSSFWSTFRVGIGVEELGRLWSAPLSTISAPMPNCS